LLSAKHPAKHPPTTQAVAVGWLLPPALRFGGIRSALYAPAFPSKERNLYQIFIKHFCLFCKKPEQSATPKDIPPCGGKTFALQVRVALMNIWVFKKPHPPNSHNQAALASFAALRIAIYVTVCPYKWI